MAKRKNRKKDKENRSRTFRAPLEAQTPTQQSYIDAINDSEQVICMGPAGTGKSYIAGTMAADMFLDGKVDKIILTRPNVGAGSSLGYFPGSLEQKMGPWLAPLINTIKTRIGSQQFESHLKTKKIEIVPLETIRGSSFDYSFIILDEAQNTTLDQLKAFVTRQGIGSKCVINGDIRQTDLSHKSGLSKLISMVSKFRMNVPLVEFGVEDIVRSGLCRDWVVAFMEMENECTDTSTSPSSTAPTPDETKWTPPSSDGLTDYVKSVGSPSTLPPGIAINPTLVNDISLSEELTHAVSPPIYASTQATSELAS